MAYKQINTHTHMKKAVLLHMDVYSSFTHDYRILEATRMSLNRT